MKFFFQPIFTDYANHWWSLALCAFKNINTNKYVYVKVKIINLREIMGSSPFCCGSVLLIFITFCFVFFALFVVVLCDYCVPSDASVPGLSIIDCPSVFSNVMHWISVHISSIIVVCRKLECFNLFHPTKHLSNEAGDSCPLAWWSIWNVKYVGRSETKAS